MIAEQPIISIQHVTKRFPGVTALSDVSFDIRQGELHAIVGENGAGKSTLMKILSGVEPTFEGRIELRGEPILFRGTGDAEHAGVSIIHQELNLVEQLSAAANIFLGRELRGRFGLIDDRAMLDAATRLFDELECSIAADATAASLRVGDQQLIEIAKALSLETEILIMDEPTSALTEAEVARLDRVIARLRSRGVTILYISHKMDEVFRLADRITVLRDGKFIKTLERPATNAREIAHLMVGREIEAVSLGEGRQASDSILRVENLSLRHSAPQQGYRLKNINFEVRRGEIIGFAGLMGAGRTELLECLFGATSEVPEGRMILAGQRLQLSHPADAVRAGIALVTEDRKRLGLLPQMDVEQNITLCALEQASQGGLLRADRERTLSIDTIRRLGVKTASPESAITSLSGGNQQKCIIGRWLLTEPRLLLLDDPTRGIDVGAKAEIYRLIDQLCRDGLGVIVTSSELPELLVLCDRILVLCEGRLTGEFTRAEATEQRIMEAATARQSN